MKLSFSILLITLLALTSCAPEHEMKLTGTVDGLKKGTLLLQKIEDSVLVSIDSIVMTGDENFEFSVSMPSAQVHYLYLRLKNGDLLDERIPFFAEEGELTITTTLEKFGTEYTVTGSKNQEKLEEYRKLMQRYANKNVLRSKYLASVNYALAQKELEISPYIMVYEIQGITQKYLDTVYKALPQNIKNSKYGMDLESLLTAQGAN